jgi:N-dimethylarginine dimethylaminohydrolase
MMSDTKVEMLLCKPEFFTVEYEINPWMDVNDPVDTELAWKQWNQLYDTLVGLGVKIHLIDPVKGLPDMVFTGDGGVVVGKRFVSSSFRPKERQPEAECFRNWFRENGYTVELLPEGVYFEGLGDIVLHEDKAIAAYGIRTSQDALDHIRAKFPDFNWVAELELVSPKFFHLGVSLSLLDDKVGMYVPHAFSEESQKVIENLDYEMLALDDEDADGFALNAIVVDRNLVVNYCSDKLKGQLEARGFTVLVCDCSEFLKSGGGTRCLVLPFAKVPPSASIRKAG